MGLADVKQPRHTSGLVLHGAARYDLLLWLLTLGRESAYRRRILNLAHLSPGERVLDIGCGTGTTAIAASRLVRPGGSVFGVDASPEMIRRARRKAGRAGVDVEFRNGLVESLPFPEAHFNVVLSTLMLHHLPGELRKQCAAEIRRVLKPGGRVLAVDFTSPEGAKGFVAHFHRHGHISFAELAGMFREAGMEIVESGPVGISDLHSVLSLAPAQEASRLTGVGWTF